MLILIEWLMVFEVISNLERILEESLASRRTTLLGYNEKSGQVKTLLPVVIWLIRKLSQVKVHGGI